MRDYEVMVIFHPENDQFQKGQETVKDEFNKNKITIIKEEDMKIRELAFPIKKETRGHYYLYEINSDPQNVQFLETSLKLSPNLLKYLFVKKE